jgi:hypothetical protein
MTIEFHQLPTELLVQILDFLTQSTIIRSVSLVNKTLYDLVLRSPDVWTDRVVVVNNSAYTSCCMTDSNGFDGWRQALLMVKNCCLRHVKFTYLPLIDLISVMTEAREHLTSLQLSWCENSFAISDYVMCRLWDLQWPSLERLAIGYYYSGGRSSVEQVFRHVVPNAPRLKHLNGFELPVLNYGPLVNLSQLESITLVNDHDNNSENSQMLMQVADKLSNLNHLELKAEGFEFPALNKLFEHTTQLQRLQVHDLFTFNVSQEFEHLTELRLSRSERVVANIVKASKNIESLQLDMHASYEVKEVANRLTNLRHLWIEKYSKSLIEIMNHCELQTLRIGNMDIRENGLIDVLVQQGKSIKVLVMDHVKLNSSADMDMIMTKLPNLKELTVNVCHTTNQSGKVYAAPEGVKTFTYGKSRMAVDVSTFATPNLKHLTYTKAKRESKYGIRPDDFQYLTTHSSNLKSMTISLFDVFNTSNCQRRFDIFGQLDSCHLTFGEYGSLAHILCALICCQNATNFSVDSLMCKAEYVDRLRLALMEEKKKDKEKYKAARSAKKLKKDIKLQLLQEKQKKDLKKDKGSSQRFEKVKKSHKRKQTCGLIQLANIVWAEMEKVFSTYSFYQAHKNVTEDLKKRYKERLVTKFNPKVSRKTSLLHEFLHVLQQRILMNDIPKKMLIYGQHN